MKCTTPGMTVMGLQRLLCILDQKVTEDVRTIAEAALATHALAASQINQSSDILST
jgi:hypothetical protein